MGKIYRTFKVRVYPNNKQETQILKTIGSCRKLYNLMLEERLSVYDKLKHDKRALYEYNYKTEKQYKEDYPFMKDVSSVALQQSRIDLSNAYQRFFKSLKKKNPVGFPKFQKKGKKDSYREVNYVCLDFKNKKVRLPKIGWVKYRDKRNGFEGKIKSATVRRTKTGKYFVAILYEKEVQHKGVLIDENLITKGLDMSMKSFFVDSDGNSPAYEHLYRKNEKRLAYLQRQVSKKKKGSKNRKKAQLKVNKLYEKIKNKRENFTHCLSKQISENNDVVIVENLNLQSMARMLKLGKSTNELGYGKFLKQLQYKMFDKGGFLIEADKWFASSQVCSKCGYKYEDLQLSERSFTCPFCGFKIDRDYNAAINLKKYGLNKLGMEDTESKPVEKPIETTENEVFKKQEVSL